MFAVGDRVAFHDKLDGYRGYAKITEIDPDGWYVVDLAYQDGGNRALDPDEDEILLLSRAVPESKREAAEQHAATGIGPTAEKSEHQKRKDQPVTRGVLDYFPDALLAVAGVSRAGNDQHNPGQPLHWHYGKSMDHADCLVRHLTDRGTMDTDGTSHTVKVAWRALALLQTELETADPELHERRQAQRDAAAKGER